MSIPSWCSNLSQEQLNSSLIDAADGRPQEALDLLEAGADPNGYPLIMAIQSPAPSVVKAMLEHGVDPNLPYLETTPLIHAVQRCDLQMVTLLLGGGANPNGVNTQGVSAMQVASALSLTGGSGNAVAVRDALVAAGGK
jgi:ankyrin repeat protein